jgi:hypothetical protein
MIFQPLSPMPAPLAQPAQWNLFCSYSIGVDVYPVECLPRAMLLAFHCTGAFHYSTGELEVNIPSGLNSKTIQQGHDSDSEVYRACPVGMKYRTGVKSESHLTGAYLTGELSPAIRANPV